MPGGTPRPTAALARVARQCVVRRRWSSFDVPLTAGRFEHKFERQRLRAWQPFEAVAQGAACFAADRMLAIDFVMHDYALVTHDAKTGEEQHVVIIPRGTRFPTAPDLWKGQVVPTYALGEPETTYSLLICEVARADGPGRRS